MSGIVGKNLGRGSGIVTATPVGADTVSGASIVDDAIDSEHYVDGSIDNAHIADDAIDSEHYVDGSIDNAHIADDAIDSEHYADGSIDNAHIADDAIDSEHYADGSIDEAHIADNAVTLAKMAGGTDGNIISYDASGDPVAIATGDDGQVLTSTGAGSPPAFEDAGGGGAWNIIGTSVASDSATIDQTGLSSTYDTYAIALSDIRSASDSVNGWLRLGDSSGIDSGASDYKFNYSNRSTDGTLTEGIDAADPQMLLISNFGNATGEGGGGLFYLHCPTDGVTFPHISGHYSVTATDGSVRGGLSFGRRSTVIAVDRVQFLLSSGNVTSGRMTVWGIAHA